MRLEQQFIEIYDYNDLRTNDELSERVRSKHRDINVDHDWWTFTTSEVENELEALGFNNVQSWFSGFSSQGDGACFDSDSIDFTKIINHVDVKHKKLLLPILEDYCSGEIYSNRFAIHYDHSKTRYFRISTGLPWKYKRIERLLDDVEKQIEKIRKDKSDELYKRLSDEYDYLTSDDAVLETLKANGYEFTIDGAIV